MSRNDFELLNIYYDIMIDEEEYKLVIQGINVNSLEQAINFSDKTDNWCIRVRKFLNEISETVTFLKYDNNQITLPQQVIWHEWPKAALFIAKNLRANLMQLNTTESLAALDDVASFLLGCIPRLTSSQEENSEILFYLEASACQKSNISLGCARKALNQLEYMQNQVNNSVEEKRNPYELWALYNIAILLAHNSFSSDKVEAINFFNKVIRAFEEEWEKYEDNARIICSNPRRLWDQFIFIPSLLGKASTLQDLNRGKESADTLDVAYCLMEDNDVFFENNIELIYNYKLYHFYLLRAFIDLDSGIIREIYNKKVVNWDALEACHIIDKQYKNFFKGKSLDLLYRDLKSRNFREREDYSYRYGNGMTSDIWKALDISKANLIDAKNKYEKADYLVSWLESFKVLLKFVKKEKVVPYGNDNCFSETSNLLLDIELFINGCKEKDGFFPRKYEILDNVFDILKDINDIDFDMKISFKLQETVIINFIKLEYQIIRNFLLKGNNWNNVTKVRRIEQLISKLKKVEDKKGYNFTSLIEEIKLIIENTAYKKYLFPKHDIENIMKEFREHIHEDQFMRIMRNNIESFDRRLIYSSQRKYMSNVYGLTVLRKWQSYTPSLSGGDVLSQGGGYFVYKTDNTEKIIEGFVIDPGYDFVENFFANQFSIADITGIILTHNHPDHVSDFRTIINLFNELNKRGYDKEKYKWDEKKITVIGTEATLAPFFEDINISKELFRDTIVVSLSDIQSLRPFNSFNLRPVHAYHEGLGHSDGMGIILEDNNCKPLIGFTSDTVWAETLEKDFESCPIMCLNLGGILDVRKDHSFTKTFDNYESICTFMFNQKHLYLPGFILLLKAISNTSKLVIISEVCEELKGSNLREEFTRWVQKFIDDNNIHDNNEKALAVVEDIGLTVKFNSSDNGNEQLEIQCFKCKTFVKLCKIKMVTREEERHSEQLYYYCEECYERYIRLTRSEQRDF